MDHLVGQVRLRQFGFTPGHRLPPHVHGYPAVIALALGSFQAVARQKRLDFSSGAAVVIPADAWHSEEVGRTGATAMVLMPNRANDRVRPAFAASAITRIERRSVRACVWRLNAAVSTSGVRCALTLEHLVEELLASMEACDDGDAVRSLPTGLRRAVDLLHDAEGEAPSLDELAGAAAMRRARFTRAFRHAFGCSAGTYLRQIRLDRAATLLRQTDLPIGQIAVATGFFDQSHLTNAFGRWAGCPPAAFRRAHRGDRRGLTHS